MIEPIRKQRRGRAADNADSTLLACIEELRLARQQLELQRCCIASLARQVAALGPTGMDSTSRAQAANADLATWKFDGSGASIEASRAFCDLLEIPDPMILAARPLAALMTDRSYRLLWEHLAPLDDRTAVTLEIEMIGQISGRHRQLAISVIPAAGIPAAGTGAERTYAAILVDVTARRNDDSCTRFLGRQDGLTGLRNRAAFEEQARQAIAIAHRNGSMVALLCVDIDRFKAVNDAHGAATGDRLLCEMASRLQAITRESDTVARFGGDEFALLATNLHDPDEAAALARKIAERLAEPYNIGGRELCCTASVGSALYPTDSDHLETLFEIADAALHRCKRDTGGNAPRLNSNAELDGSVGLFRRLAEPSAPWGL